MNVLIVEWLTSGGLWVDRVEPDLGCPFQSQGAQMLAAIVEDVLQADVDVVLPIDIRFKDRFRPVDGLRVKQVDNGLDFYKLLAGLAQEVDYVILIAPESRSCLLTCVRSINCGQRLISPDLTFVEIASNKQTTFDYLSHQGFRFFPAGGNFSDYQTLGRPDFPTPAVLKPLDGAGSEEVHLIDDWLNWEDRARRLHLDYSGYRLERLVSGTPVSVSVICRGAQKEFLVPTVQVFDREPFGNYLGARFPVEPSLAARATRLAQRAMDAMPNTRGYVGLDLVISDQHESLDCLIEINPRLTMSYLTLRKIYSENLALKMLPS